MGELLDFLSSYSLEDFMPMGLDIYLRLYERVNASFWPWHFVTLIISLVIPILLLRGREKLAWPLLGSMWVLVGWHFHWQFFAELNWAAVYYAWGFMLQGVLLSLAYFRPVRVTVDRKRRGSKWLGVALISISVMVFPILAPISNQSWQQVQMFGVSPDPTCLYTLGVILVSNRKAWWLVPLPILWCVLSGAISYVFYLPSGLILMAFGLMFLIVETRRKKSEKWFSDD